MMVVFNELMYIDNAVFVSFDLFENMVGLDLRQYFYHGLLKTGAGHQRRIIWCSKSFLSNLNFLNRLHPITNLIVHLVHEVSDAITCSSGSFSRRLTPLED
jgi:hypothetical protein